MCGKVKEMSVLVTPNYYISKKLIELGITNNYIAYYYLVDILDALVNDMMVIRAFSHDVYPKLAEKYNKSECTIERDIRNIINIFWESRLKEKLYPFWEKDKAPTCRDFIFLLKRYLIHEIS